MKPLKPLSLVLFVCLLLHFSCSNEKENGTAAYGPVFESVMLTNNGTFRGLDLGASMDSVMKKETAEPVEADHLYLYYEYKLDNGLGSYDITYDFDENGLSEIHSDLYLRDTMQTDTTFSGFKKYFDKTYGTSENHGGFYVWTVRSESFGKVRVNLSDGSAEPSPDGSPGKISLWIYTEKE